MTQQKITIDFETRSEANIMDVGAYAYSIHPSTEPLCLAYKIPGQETKLWTRLDEEPPIDLFEAIEDDFDNFLIEAHNSFFELCIWTNVCEKKLNWPALPFDRIRCSAAKAAMHSLPRNLEDACAAMRLPVQKDKYGKTLIKLLCCPQKPTKNDSRIWINEDDEIPVKIAKNTFETPANLFKQLGEYCIQDVEAEEGLSDSLADLPEMEQKIWEMDQTINWRGFYSDIPLARVADEVLAVFEKEITANVVKLTNNFITKATQITSILLYCDFEGVELPNLQADTVDKALQREDLPGDVRKLLELRQLGGRSSAKKFQKFMDMADEEQVIRGTLMYHGATTGRWTGKGVQTQNLIRGIFTKLEEIEECIALIEARDFDKIREKYDNPVEAIASIVRSVITARPGYELFVADYSSIEARVLVWVANDNTAVNIFERGDDIYLDMAYDIFKIDAAAYENLDDYKKWFYRFVGKQAILGLGYQMGAPRFAAEVLKRANIKLDPELCQDVVYTYRDKYSKVTKLWGRCEKAAIHATKFRRGPDRPCKVGKVKYYVKNNFLCCELPSGRCIRYHRPRVEPYEWNGVPKEKLTYWGVHPVSKRYMKLDTYGGSLVESICQGIARDVMSYAALDVEDAGYDILTSVHDELISEREEGKGSIEEYEQLLTNIPAWAKGCPIDAEGWKGKRYKK